MPADPQTPDHLTEPGATPGVVATGVGSWSGEDVREALRMVRGELASGQAPDGVAALPYLPELPDRGPGAAMVGRTAQLLVDLPVDLQPQGWRLVDHPGRDAERAAAWWRQDLDELAEAFDGYAGPLKVQVAGPWTLAASLWLPLGDRVLSDPGATRDLTASLAEGVAAHVREVCGLLPGAALTVQVDEPLVGTVLLGRVRSDSGYRVLRTPETGEVVTGLRTVLEAAVAAGAGRTVVHTCEDDPPVVVLAQAGPSALSLDVTRLSTAGWDAVAEAVEEGAALWAGLLPTGEGTAYRPVVDHLLTRWHELGLPAHDLRHVGVTPACGLAGATPEAARAATTATVQTAARLAEHARA